MALLSCRFSFHRFSCIRAPQRLRCVSLRGMPCVCFRAPQRLPLRFALLAQEQRPDLAIIQESTASNHRHRRGTQALRQVVLGLQGEGGGGQRGGGGREGRGRGRGGC